MILRWLESGIMSCGNLPAAATAFIWDPRNQKWGPLEHQCDPITWVLYFKLIIIWRCSLNVAVWHHVCSETYYRPTSWVTQYRRRQAWHAALTQYTLHWVREYNHQKYTTHPTSSGFLSKAANTEKTEVTSSPSWTRANLGINYDNPEIWPICHGAMKSKCLLKWSEHCIYPQTWKQDEFYSPHSQWNSELLEVARLKDISKKISFDI